MNPACQSIIPGVKIWAWAPLSHRVDHELLSVLKDSGAKSEAVCLTAKALRTVGDGKGQ